MEKFGYGLVLLCFAVAVSVLMGTASAETWVVDDNDDTADFTSIQDAVDEANAGDTIEVRSGTYDENVDVNKSLTLIGDGAYVVTVQSKDRSSHVFEVTADYVNISGFKVTGTGTTYETKAGFYLDGADHCNISNNDASENHYGIYLNSASDNTLSSNNASENRYGVHLKDSSNNNTLSKNTVSGNTAEKYDDGIYLESSNNNTLTENTASENQVGISLHRSSNNTLTNNNASGNNEYGIYLYMSSNNTLTNNNASGNRYGIYMSESSNNTLTNNTASSNDDGIKLRYSSNNTLSSNTASGNSYGIYLYTSSDNTLTNNNASGNDYDGIELYYSSNNELTDNTMSDNSCNFCVGGVTLSDYIHNIDASNMVDGKPVYYWVSQQDQQIPNDAGYVGVVNSTNITVKDLTLTNNGQGVLLAYTSNSRLSGNTITNNYHGVHITPDASGNIINFNNIVGNSRYGYGLYNENISVNATCNWWGDVSGPSGAGDGTGDAISAHVDYAPWLDSPYLEGEPIYFTNATKNTTGTGTTEIDAREVADTNVTINTTAPVNVTIGNYSANPGAVFDEEIGKYIDVHVNDAMNVSWIKIRLYYTYDEIKDLHESSLWMCWWNGSEWLNCSDTGVNTTDVGNYSGYVWANINNTTTPGMGDLNGSALAPRGRKRPPPPLQGRSAGIYPSPTPSPTPTPTSATPELPLTPELPTTPASSPSVPSTPSPPPTPPSSSALLTKPDIPLVIAMVTVVASAVYLILRRRKK